MTPPLTTHEWAAGIIDGEGCFTLNGYHPKPKRPDHRTGKMRKPYNTPSAIVLNGVKVWPVLSVTQHSHVGEPEMLQRLKRLYGGRIAGPFFEGHASPQYHLILSSRLVQKVLPQFWPWLGEVKRAQALSVGFRAPN